MNKCTCVTMVAFTLAMIMVSFIPPAGGIFSLGMTVFMLLAVWYVHRHPEKTDYEDSKIKFLSVRRFQLRGGRWFI